ncbi:hypothetical protein [Candidatus Igneacidithiobacillus taiwanensis]|uniref:hypothetical protein n=1 Tax=Candidatus Igneacidithiobacillus taiwanensis TaxID=1945924 RepID=UPI00289A0740|nr:hypothetical protein [Candidatus Igneacidithiobacillus taiwanensis]MCE5360537.1 hypothetical protein [Acidithiobacillus sp.]
MLTGVAEEVAATIYTDGNNIDLFDLGDYFMIFSLLYRDISITMSSDFRYISSIQDINQESVTYLAEKYRSSEKSLEFYRNMQLDLFEYIRYRDRLDKRYRLAIRDIKRENPLLVVFEGIAISLAVAAILSGGKYEIGPLRVELPPIAKGLEELISLFRKK